MIEGLAVRLKEKRQALGLSRKVVSEVIGISASTLADYENGHIEPSLKVLMKLATLYKCSTDYLLGMEKELPQAVLDVSSLNSRQIQALKIITEGLH
ncbi:helix-turn-helix domain-containing protein [Candidatus Weimeria sp. HCP3S3_B5]|uniref:helix-turn-helix domain-containing protein n=1 Tax=Candidatus Weimeria sp. HCP3S3_B5 TaxID=3438871 RepID=UPI003F8A6F82